MYYHRDSQTCTESSLCEEGVGCWGASEAQSLCCVCPVTTTQAPKISQGKCMPQKKCTLFSNMYFQFHYEEENKMLPCTCQNSRLYVMFWRGKKQEVQWTITLSKAIDGSWKGKWQEIYRQLSVQCCSAPKWQNHTCKDFKNSIKRPNSWVHFSLTEKI